MKICPRCAEEVKQEAQVCRFCGYDFEKATQERPVKDWISTHPLMFWFIMIAVVVGLVVGIVVPLQQAQDEAEFERKVCEYQEDLGGDC